ncbi:hypothetical protein [Thermus tengchongensis]|uniref:hypothetical protein n=1 Tax=Thermus tengchongensis TaxID=1214928 RepID=UPI001F2EA3D8|nr:hypothetical protein [Thermus tengchongensis]
MDAKTLVLIALLGGLAYLGWKALGGTGAKGEASPDEAPPPSGTGDNPEYYPVPYPVYPVPVWDPGYQNGGLPGFGLGSFVNPCAAFPSLCRPLVPIPGGGEA